MAKKSMKESNKLNLVSLIVNFRLAKLRNSESYLSFGVLLATALFFMRDIYIDIVVAGEGLSHVLIEGSFFIAVLLALGFELKRVMGLSSSLSIHQKEIKRLKKYMADIIGREFDRWYLTKTEKEIALLLIRGHSMQEIAELRKVKEKSVRQQSTRIYTKGKVSNRYELASYFMGDLLEPEIG